MRKKFLRSLSKRYSKLGRRRKKKQKWRKPKGRDNKIRESKAGHIKKVKIGMKKTRKIQAPLIHNLRHLENTKAKEITIAKIGKKKKKELVNRAEELGIKVLNPKIRGRLKEKKSKENKKEDKQKSNNKNETR